MQECPPRDGGHFFIRETSDVWDAR
jgi:hypothetical protein